MVDCIKCGGITKGYKCDICNAVSKRHMPSHSCGTEHSMFMCARCNEAEANCKCGKL
ncbi:MAG: hypothetical protein AABX38_03220 [Candidatus Micrarchaeota archaeon]